MGHPVDVCVWEREGVGVSVRVSSNGRCYIQISNGNGGDRQSFYGREKEKEKGRGERRVTMLSAGSYVRIESLGGKTGARFFSLALLTPCLKLLLGFES